MRSWQDVKWAAVWTVDGRYPLRVCDLEEGRGGLWATRQDGGDVFLPWAHIQRVDIDHWHKADEEPF